MGGNAFIHANRNGKPGLYVPRMRPETYIAMRTHAITILRGYFEHVDVPCAVPGKKDHGDVDCLVAGFKGDKKHERYFEILREAFNTRYAYSVGEEERCCMFFAVPSPEEGSSEGDKRAYIQIDVQVCRNAKMFDWERQRLGYASLPSMILGSVGHPLGLTKNPDGLFLRVPGLDKVDCNGSLILLTQDWIQLLKFFGVDIDMYGKFQSEDEIYEWLVKSRVFQLNLDHFANRWRDATFRKRIQEHKHYPYFLCTWLPNYLEERSKDFTDGGKRNESACTQDDSTTLPAIVLQWVSETWPEARKEYDSKLSTHLKDSAEKHVRDIISAAIPLPPPPELQTQSNAQVASKSVQNPMGRTAAMRAVLRWTKFDDDGKPTIEETPSDENLKNRWSESSLSEGELVAWVQSNWHEMRRRLRERQDARYRRDIESGKIKPKIKKTEAVAFSDDLPEASRLLSASDVQSPET